MTTNDKLARAEAMDLMREVEVYRKALSRIREIAKPGQTLHLGDAIDAMCDCWNISRTALNTDRSA